MAEHIADTHWPDPSRPGVPDMPDQRDFHWVDVGNDEPLLLVGDWCPTEGNWFFDGGVTAPEELAACRYLGAVVTPTEFAATVRETERAGARAGAAAGGCGVSGRLAGRRAGGAGRGLRGSGWWRWSAGGLHRFLRSLSGCRCGCGRAV